MNRRWTPWMIAAAVFILDRVSKIAIKKSLGPWDTLRVIPGLFNIIHTENPGVAFGLFANASNPFRTLILIGLSGFVLVLIAWTLLRPPKPGEKGNALMRAALALVLGGAFGNLYDRVVHGTVTDFVEVYADNHYFPAFNLADSSITVGACLLIIDILRSREKEPRPINAPQ